MKQFVCEICGGNSVIKDSGVFMCQGCGCKYSAEEVRAQMVEVEGGEAVAQVPAQPQVPAVNQKLQNLRVLAERALSENDSQTAAKYFSDILTEDPNDWKANFYSIYFSAMDTTVANMGSSANRVANCLSPALKLVKENVTDETERREAWMEIMTRVQSFFTMIVNNIGAHMGTQYHTKMEAINNWFLPAISMLVSAGDGLLTQLEEYDGANTEYDLAQQGIGSARDMCATLNASLSYTGGYTNNITRGLPQRISDMSGVISQRKRTVSDLKRKKVQEEKQQRRESYWAEHAGEKAALEAEKARLEGEQKELSAQLSTLKQKKADVPAQADFLALTKQISELESQRNGLGLFKGKEKKALTEQIDDLNKRLEGVRKQRDAQQEAVESEITPYRAQLDKVNARLRQINDEFNRDR